jgi:nucleoside-diphosphate-sugar epimerase
MYDKNNIMSEDREILEKNCQMMVNIIEAGNFKKFINIGSGAEFDLRRNIHEEKEENIRSFNPIDSYGKSKNMMARYCSSHEKFYTLRLFGCFGSTEEPTRLLQRFRSMEKLKIQDRMFDYFGVEDFYKVLKYYILSPHLKYKDVNCVYPEKITLTEFLHRFKSIHNIDNEIIFNGYGKEYTGCGYRLADLSLDLFGMNECLRKYK